METTIATVPIDFVALSREGMFGLFIGVLLLAGLVMFLAFRAMKNQNEKHYEFIQKMGEAKHQQLKETQDTFSQALQNRDNLQKELHTLIENHFSHVEKAVYENKDAMKDLTYKISELGEIIKGQRKQ